MGIGEEGWCPFRDISIFHIQFPCLKIIRWIESLESYELSFFMNANDLRKGDDIGAKY